MGRKSGTVVLVAAALGLLSGCSAAEPEPGPGSTPEPSAPATEPLTVYSGRAEELVAPVLEDFTDQTGIAVQVRYADSAQLASQLIEEGERSPADVFFAQDAGALGAVSKAGLAAPVPAELLDRVPETYRSSDWVGVSGRARVVVYDPRDVSDSDVPSSTADLTDPTWAGQVGIAPANASFQSFVTAMRVSEGEDAARAWLEAMVANDVQTFEGNTAILDAVDAGVIDAGLINHYYWFRKGAEAGEAEVPSRLAFLPGGDPGALVNVAGALSLRTSDQPDQAEALLGFLLSEPAQAFFAAETFEYPLLAEVDPAADLPPLEDIEVPPVDLSDLDALDATIAMLEEVGLL